MRNILVKTYADYANSFQKTALSNIEKKDYYNLAVEIALIKYYWVRVIENLIQYVEEVTDDGPATVSWRKLK